MTTLARTVSQKSLTKKFHHSKYGKKENGQIQGRISRRRLLRNPTIQYIIINLLTKYDYSSSYSFTEIIDEKFHHSKYGKKEYWTNTGKNKQEKAGLPQYSMSSSICIPNMTLLACKVVEKSLTKKCYGITEGRMDGRRDGRTDRCKLVYPPPPFSKPGYNEKGHNSKKGDISDKKINLCQLFLIMNPYMTFQNSTMHES